MATGSHTKRTVKHQAKQTAKGTASRRQRKTLDVDQQLLDEARRALGCNTETETMRRALEEVVARKRIANGIRWLGGRKLFDRTKIED